MGASKESVHSNAIYAEKLWTTYKKPINASPTPTASKRTLCSYHGTLPTSVPHSLVFLSFWLSLGLSIYRSQWTLSLD